MVQQCPSNSKDRKLSNSQVEAKNLGEVKCSDRLGLEDLVSYIRPACASHCVTNFSSRISITIKKGGKPSTNETQLIFEMLHFLVCCWSCTVKKAYCTGKDYGMFLLLNFFPSSLKESYL